MKTLRVHPDKEPQFTKRKRLNITRKIDKGTDLFIIPKIFNDENCKVHQKKMKKIERITEYMVFTI